MSEPQVPSPSGVEGLPVIRDREAERVLAIKDYQERRRAMDRLMAFRAATAGVQLTPLEINDLPETKGKT